MSRELASDLRELAADGERPPTLTGAEIRGRAVRRRRRRRTALAAAGVSVAGALALVLSLSPGGGTRHDPPPAASPTVTPSPSSSAAPDATIDLGRRVISVAGRELTLTSDNLTGYVPDFRSTVAGKEPSMMFSGKTVGLGGTYSFKASWAIELVDPDGRTNFVGAMTNDGQGRFQVSHGWIGLREADAKWLYERLAPGSVVEIRPSSGGPSSPNPTAVHGGSVTAGAGTATGSAAPGSGTPGG
ncbi:L,D-transpeptidase family protein [Streptomyces sp. NPDC091209]|uniref:L,D-transpeptidase family protein n=1 Tax=Streptomyces sp. NPDC091209 TaxID=3365974 RepID=UPI0037F32442